MDILNKSQVDTLFQREAVMLGGEDCVPDHRVAILFGIEAVKHVRRMDRDNKARYKTGYGIGDFTLFAITYRGFLAAASYYNVKQLRKDAEDYEKKEAQI